MLPAVLGAGSEGPFLRAGSLGATDDALDVPGHQSDDSFARYAPPTGRQREDSCRLSQPTNRVRSDEAS